MLLAMSGAETAALRSELVGLRRELHRIPEIGLRLPHTQHRVLAALDGLPLEVTLGTGLSSVTAVLRGRGPGPVVLLRGDMDGLPIAEESGEEFASTHEGAMHACGHDLHMAGLVGAARLLARRRAEFDGAIVFMFQPGEEGCDGAAHMLSEGVLRAAGRPAVAAYGLHVLPSMLPTGVFASRPGTLMAAADSLIVRVVGAGGHGSKPADALDPIPAACEMVTALQTMVTRRFDVFDPVVLTVGTFHAGTKRNVIPEDATFEATVRTFSPAVGERVRAQALALCQHIAAAHGLRVEVAYEPRYPPTVNDREEFDFVAGTVREVFGLAQFVELDHPVTASEDFSRVLAEVPGAFVLLGADVTGDPSTAPDIHAARARFDDGVLADAAMFLAELALRRLRRP